jgi:hypothetical protein
MRRVSMTSKVSTQDELREIYGFPKEDSYGAHGKLPYPHAHHQAFIALSPFMIIATTDETGCPDNSPRGDLPGFVAVTDKTP